MFMLRTLTVSDACKAARRLLIDGDHVGAAEALSRFWDGVYSRPHLARLSKRNQAALLIACGKVVTAKARASQVEGLYAEAINLIGDAIHILEDLNQSLADAQDALANCYLRKGENAKARTILLIARSETDSIDFNEWTTLTVSLARVHVQDAEPEEACKLLSEVAPAVDLITDPLTRANYHHTYANVLHQLEKFPAASIEYAGASYYFEAAGFARLAAAVENNLADLKIRMGQPKDAHPHLDSAERFYRGISDRAALGQTLETRAACYLAENNLPAALDAIDMSLDYLMGGEEKVFLATSWFTRGDILKRMGRPREAEESYGKAALFTRLAAAKTSPLRLVESLPTGADDGNTSDSLEGVLRVTMPDSSLIGLNIREGDQVVVALNSTCKHCDLVVLEFKGQLFAGVYVKSGDLVILEADNQEYEDLEFKKGEVKIKGKVVGYIKAEDIEADDLRVRRLDDQERSSELPPRSILC